MGNAVRTKEVLALRKGLRHATGEDRAHALSLLADRPFRTARAVHEWHDLMLFLLAYPASRSEHSFATKELQRTLDAAAHRSRKSEHERMALIDSGMAGCPVQSSFSLPMVRWILAHWSEKIVLLHSSASHAEQVRVLRLLLPSSVHDALELSEEPILAAFGRTHALAGLVEALVRTDAPEAVRNDLYDRLEVFVQLDTSGTPFSTSTARGPMGRLHTAASSTAPEPALLQLIARPLSAAIPLSSSEQQALIETSRGALCAFRRETDPITYASHVDLHDMGQGLRLALFTPSFRYRLPFDSYVGFMAYMNGIPMAYGGSWIFPGKSKVGLNVLPPFRGGNSTRLFAQLLRLYARKYRVERFEAENYQLGHQNPEGLRSGAYWFYYRAGFRPTEKAFARIAAREFARLQRDRSYRTPVQVLRQLVSGTLVLDITIGPHDIIDVGILSPLALDRSSMISGTAPAFPLAGDPAGWSRDELEALRLWAPVLHAAAEITPPTAQELRSVLRTVRAKAGTTEQEHALLLREQHWILGALARTVAGS